MIAKSAMPISLLCLSLSMGGVGAAAAAQSKPNASAHANAAIPAALRPALYQSLAHDAGTAYAIDKGGCATLPKQRLEGCFTVTGARFHGAGAKPLALQLTAWGRGNALHAVSRIAPAIKGNRVSYAHGTLSEWWRMLPVGFEQGFTITRRPGGDGELLLALESNGKAATKDGALAFGKLRYGDLVVTDADGRVVPARLATENGHILIAANDGGARYPLTIDPLVWTEQKATAGDGGPGNFLGWALAISGQRAIVGAPFAKIGGNIQQGAAYVFIESGGTWAEQQKLTADDGAANENFGSFVAIDGQTVVICAPFATVGGNSHQGAAYVFAESGGTWSQTQKLTADDGAADDYFGSSAAVSGNTAMVGEDSAKIGNNFQQGAVYVFARSGGTWSQLQKLTANDGAQYDSFGYSVSVDATSALIGAPNVVVGGNDFQGAAYVFTDSGGTWSQAAKLTADDGQSQDLLGYSAAISDSTLVIGAVYATVGGNVAQGAAYVFSKSGGTWSQTQKLTASDGAEDNYFGNSVAINGTTVLVGAPHVDVGSNGYQGAAYIYTESAGVWSEGPELTASDGSYDDAFGFSVGFNGTVALVGSPGAVVGGNLSQGAAYAYTASCPQGYGEYDGSLAADGLYGSPTYQAPAGLENGILGGPGGFQLYAQYSNGGAPHLFPIPGNEIHKLGPAGTYRWGVKAGGTGGDYVLCILHP